MKLSTLSAFLLVISLPAQALQQLRIQPSRTFQQQSNQSVAQFQRPRGAADSLARIIVEFKEEPLFSPAHSGRRPDEGPYQQRFERLAGDLGAAGVRLSAPGIRTSPLPPFSRTFTKTFFGANLAVPASQLPDILKLPYVKAIHRDRPVTKSIEKSAAQMGVPQVWQAFATQGAGVRIGIIDTGIDYLHPALGGGFGTGFKVAGGYDFVNDDTDPMDDDSHGSHVAGIVAAETDSIKGIAPNATLFAYKVLDETGSGFESDVIAAIEMAADPDGNNDPSDRLDIVNLSLGSEQGASTDPSSIAVNNASKLGIVFCVAAGNAGYAQSNHNNNYFLDGSATIGSPGTAESAITVGAVDSTDILAPFSSKGPNRFGFGIKPDVVAPGVKILSTVLNSSYAAYNGTSMATPMVTGVAALLKAAHPEWPTERLRSAIINTARDIGISAFHQGGGRVQAFKAASSNAWLRPTSLSYGLDDPSLSMWTKQETLYVHNDHASTQTFTSTVTGLAGGIGLSISPSGFTISSGDSMPIVVTLAVDNASIPVESGNITRFTGRVRLEGTIDTIAAAWGFARGAVLRLEFNEPSPQFLIYGGPTFIPSWSPSVHWPGLTTAVIYGLSPATYGTITVFPSASGAAKFLVKDRNVLSDNETIAIHSTEATIPLLYQGVDHNGGRISAYPSPRKILVTTIPLFGDWVTEFETPSDTVLASPVGTDFAFRASEIQFDAPESRSFHIVQYPPFSGIQTPKVFVNTSTNFVSQQFVLKYPPGTSQAIVVGEFFGYKESGGQGLLMGNGYGIDTVSVTGDEAHLSGYFGRSSDATLDAAVVLHSLSDLSTTQLDFSTLPIMISQDSILAVTKDDALITTKRSPSGGRMTFGGPPVHLLALWYNNVFAPASLHFNAMFRGMQRESRFKDVNHGTYTVYDTVGNVVFSNPLNDFPRAPRAFTPHRYRVVMTSANHWLGPISGEVKLTSEFNLATSPANPPTFTSFQVLDSLGRPTHVVRKGSPASLLFSSLVINFSNEVLPVADSTRAWYRVHGTAEWMPLVVQNIANDPLKEGAVYAANLSAALTLDSAAIDLRVASEDERGYSADYEISPAFGVGEWLADSLVTVVGNDIQSVPAQFALHQNYPNPFNPETAVSYQLSTASVVRLRVYDMLGRVVATLVDGELPAGMHRATWNASGFPSGVYFYRIQAESGFIETKKMILVR